MKDEIKTQIREIITKCEPHKEASIRRPLQQILKKELSSAKGSLENSEEVIKDFLEELMTAYEASKLRSKNIIRMLFMESIELAKRLGLDTEALARELLYLSLQDSESRRKKPVQKKIQDKRERILEAALKVISKKGYESATIEMIAEQAGVSKGSVYRYYSSKENLVKEIINAMFDVLAEKINDSMHEDLDALGIIELHLRSYLEFIEDNKDFYRMLLNSRNIMGPAVRSQYYTRVLEYMPVMKHKITEAAEQGKIKSTSFFTVYYGIMGFLDGVIHKWLHANCSYPLVGEVPIILENLFYGIVTEEYAKNHREYYVESVNLSSTKKRKKLLIKTSRTSANPSRDKSKGVESETASFLDKDVNRAS